MLGSCVDAYAYTHRTYMYTCINTPRGAEYFPEQTGFVCVFVSGDRSKIENKMGRGACVIIYNKQYGDKFTPFNVSRDVNCFLLVQET